MDVNSFITGFVEGEGCFCISFSKRAKLNTGIEVRPSFALSQHKRNLKLLQSIHSEFQCGAIRYSRRDQNYKFEVRSIKDLMKIVIPFFEKYPLLGIKNKDFQNFKKVCELVYTNQHRNKERLGELINLAYQINSSGKKKYTKEELLRHIADEEIV